MRRFAAHHHSMKGNCGISSVRQSFAVACILLSQPFPHHFYIFQIRCLVKPVPLIHLRSAMVLKFKLFICKGISLNTGIALPRRIRADNRFP